MKRSSFVSSNSTSHESSRKVFSVLPNYLPCNAMASRKGCRSVSTEETESDGGGQLGGILGVALETLGGGALPHKKLIRSSLRMVLRRFFTQANTSLLRLC